MPQKSGKALVIVESPTKAKTIAGFLPSHFTVEASVGHVRDLPSSAAEIPAAVRGQSWARTGIDIENDFRPLYVVPAAKKAQVKKLKDLVANADELYLATDEDREGESISWHLMEVLKPKVRPKRLVFHEITRDAIQKALQSPRELDEGLVQAQETRRILDRLYGYEVSPILWRKIGPGLSAGRVQSVAVRLIVERERERQRFVQSSYWDLSAQFDKDGALFPATLLSVGGRRVASGRDFDSATGKLLGGDALLLDEGAARALKTRLEGVDWRVSKVDSKEFTERPQPPFTTSTLQQEANRKLRLSARATMQAAQRLYENGFITYMRTDSTSLSEEALRATRALVNELYGPKFLPAAPRVYKTKVKNAQEAHEAIRPSGEFKRPEELRAHLGLDELRVYELIWKRTMASQMADARGQRVSVHVAGADAVFQASGKTIEFPGFLRAYVEGADDPDAELADKEVVLPAVRAQDAVRCAALEARGHTTQPPARYTEASLVKKLEDSGVGRPSTYAMIIDTITRREYVVKQRNALVPTFMAFAVVGLLERHFTHLVDVNFTAEMEGDLDAISRGEKDWLPYLRHFYFGSGAEHAAGADAGLKRLLDSEIDPRESCTLPVGVDEEGRAISVRIGRYGPYLERSEQRANIPEGLAPDELNLEKALELLEAGSGQRQLGTDPDSGKAIYLKAGRFGPYVQLGENGEEPKMKSLLPGMVAEEVTLEAALRLLSLPRTVGIDPSSGEPILSDLGRYGPYIRRGSDSRSLESAEQIFSIDLESALAILATEKKRGFRGGAPKVLRQLGQNPAGADLQILSGRFGPYVTDGTTNASLPKGLEPEQLGLEQALELLAARAAAGGSKKKASRKAAKKVSKKAANPAQGAPSAPKAAKKTSKKAAKKTAKKAAKKG